MTPKIEIKDFKGPRVIPPTVDNIQMVENMCFRHDQDLMDYMMACGMDKGEAVRYINVKYNRPIK